jgi:hypothetical protein
MSLIIFKVADSCERCASKARPFRCYRVPGLDRCVKCFNEKKGCYPQGSEEASASQVAESAGPLMSWPIQPADTPRQSAYPRRGKVLLFA